MEDLMTVIFVSCVNLTQVVLSYAVVVLRPPSPHWLTKVCAPPRFDTVERRKNKGDPQHDIFRVYRNAARMTCPKNGVGPVSTAAFLPDTASQEPGAGHR